MSKLDSGINRISFLRINKVLVYRIIIIVVLRRDRKGGSARVHTLTGGVSRYLRRVVNEVKIVILSNAARKEVNWNKAICATSYEHKVNRIVLQHSNKPDAWPAFPLIPPPHPLHPTHPHTHPSYPHLKHPHTLQLQCRTCLSSGSSRSQRKVRSEADTPITFPSHLFSPALPSHTPQCGTCLDRDHKMS